MSKLSAVPTAPQPKALTTITKKNPTYCTDKIGSTTLRGAYDGSGHFEVEERERSSKCVREALCPPPSLSNPPYLAFTAKSGWSIDACW